MAISLPTPLWQAVQRPFLGGLLERGQASHLLSSRAWAAESGPGDQPLHHRLRQQRRGGQQECQPDKAPPSGASIHVHRDDMQHRRRDQ